MRNSDTDSNHSSGVMDMSELVLDYDPNQPLYRT